MTKQKVGGEQICQRNYTSLLSQANNNFGCVRRKINVYCTCVYVCVLRNIIESVKIHTLTSHKT